MGSGLQDWEALREGKGESWHWVPTPFPGPALPSFLGFSFPAQAVDPAGLGSKLLGSGSVTSLAAGFQGPTGYKGEQGEVGKDGEKVKLVVSGLRLRRWQGGGRSALMKQLLCTPPRHGLTGQTKWFGAEPLADPRPPGLLGKLPELGPAPPVARRAGFSPK